MTDPPQHSPTAQATAILSRIREGDSSAQAELLPLVYDELRALAGHYFRAQRSDHTLEPTALVHEAFLKMVGSGTDFADDRAHFMAIAAQAMRQVLINHARDRKAQKRGGGVDRSRITLDRALAVAQVDELDILALGDALAELERLSERQARIVEMRVFGGMTIEDAAQVLGVGVTTVKTDWQFARAWLKREFSRDN